MTVPNLSWQRVVDFSALTMVIYLVLRWSQHARALRLTLGILGLETVALIARPLDLWVTAWLLHATALGAGIVLIVLFQPELRHALNQLDFLMRRPGRRQGTPSGLDAIGAAAFSLAGAGRGAIIVLTRRDAVNELVSGGVPLGGQVSVEILEAVFRKVSPVHDGATIVEGDRITRVGAVLPLSQRRDLPTHWGTRHRAAMGLSERSDAVLVVASEERREVTVMHDGTHELASSADPLSDRLRSLIAPSTQAVRHPTFRLDRLVLGVAALALALVVWTATFVLTGTVERTLVIPVTFANLAAGLVTADQTAHTAQLRLRGPASTVDAMATSTLTVEADLRGLEAGLHGIDVSVGWPGLPAGVVVEDVSPRRVFVRLSPALSETAKE